MFNEKSEAVTIGILLKKTCNFISRRLQYCEVYKNNYFENRLWTPPSENQQSFFLNPFKPFIILNFAMTEWFCM